MAIRRPSQQLKFELDQTPLLPAPQANRRRRELPLAAAQVTPPALPFMLVLPLYLWAYGHGRSRVLSLKFHMLGHELCVVSELHVRDSLILKELHSSTEWAYNGSWLHDCDDWHVHQSSAF